MKDYTRKMRKKIKRAMNAVLVFLRDNIVKKVTFSFSRVIYLLNQEAYIIKQYKKSYVKKLSRGKYNIGKSIEVVHPEFLDFYNKKSYYKLGKKLVKSYRKYIKIQKEKSFMSISIDDDYIESKSSTSYLGALTLNDKFVKKLFCTSESCTNHFHVVSFRVEYTKLKFTVEEIRELYLKTYKKIDCIPKGFTFFPASEDMEIDFLERVLKEHTINILRKFALINTKYNFSIPIISKFIIDDKTRFEELKTSVQKNMSMPMYNKTKDVIHVIPSNFANEHKVYLLNDKDFYPLSIISSYGSDGFIFFFNNYINKQVNDIMHKYTRKSISIKTSKDSIKIFEYLLFFEVAIKEKTWLKCFRDDEIVRLLPNKEIEESYSFINDDFSLTNDYRESLEMSRKHIDTILNHLNMKRSTILIILTLIISFFGLFISFAVN